MKLSKFIVEDMETILQEWENFAKTIYPDSQATDTKALRDHAEEMLKIIVADLDTPQAEEQSIKKSKGLVPKVKVDTAAEIHAATRLADGFSIDQLMAEYRALRASVLRLWEHRAKTSERFEAAGMVRFNEAIDQAQSESVTRFSLMRQQAQNLFLAILAHDVRTPIGAIGMGSQVLLRDETLPTKFLKVAARIQNSSKRIDEIVCDLLDFATTTTGEGFPISRAPIDLAITCNNAVEEASAFHPERIIALEVTGDLHGDLDSARISQVFSNLISNALQHGSETAPVKLFLSGEPTEIICAVHNEGEPISPENLQLLFDPVRRYALRPAAERSVDHKQNLGLGLHIAKEIIKAHGGKIDIVSTADEGTTFTVRLPRQAP